MNLSLIQGYIDSHGEHFIYNCHKLLKKKNTVFVALYIAYNFQYKMLVFVREQFS